MIRHTSSPASAVIMLATIIMVAEFMIMAVIEGFFRADMSSQFFALFWELLDPLLLVIIVSPALYFMVLRPMARQQAQLQQQFDELTIAAVAFETQEGIFVADAETNIIKVNHAFTVLTGYDSVEVRGKTAASFNSGQQDDEFYRRLWESVKLTGSWCGEIWNRRKNGEAYLEWLTITAVRESDGDVQRYIGNCFDVTERNMHEKQIYNLAYYDPLTGLPNRSLLIDRLKKALADTARDHRYNALILLDMDHFKTLNDVYGHELGDQLLRQVSVRIAACVREQDTVSRFGGDEFIVMLKGLSNKQEIAAAEAELVAEKIRVSLSELYYLSHESYSGDKPEIEYRLTGSIGIALFCGHEQSVEELLKRTDIAMYSAKASGRNSIRFFDPAMQSAIEKRQAVETGLKIALDTHQFRLYYQAQLDSTYRTLGAEVLLRWGHPQDGLISPAQFIPVAEETGLILPIGQWVLDSACAQLKLWQNDPGFRELQLAVNVSAKQFHQIDFVEQVIATVKSHGITPGLLKLELTESVVLDKIDVIIKKMQLLKEFGVKFSLDDFGTGYSSLSYLKRLPLDQIKIDQSFVRDVATDKGDRVMITTIVNLGRNFGLEVIAEGVENETQFKLLQQSGCEVFQGYLFSRPVPVEQFESLVWRAVNRPDIEH